MQTRSGHSHLPVYLKPCSDSVSEHAQKNTMDSIFSYTNLVHAISGAAGSLVAMTVFYPLDIARTRLQVDDKRQSKHTHIIIYEIAKEEGLRNLYRGWFPVVATLCCSNFVYFYSYNSLKQIFLGQSGKPDAVKDLVCAYIAGVINVLVTTPLWVVNTRLKLQGGNFRSDKAKELKNKRYSGILDALYKIIKYEGVKQLWNGTGASVILAANPSIHFMVYEFLKRFFQNHFGTEELSGFLYFIIGAIAKTYATVLTYPLQIVQSRLRAGLHKTENFVSNIVQIIRMNGLKGLYKGMEAKLIQTVLTAALMFVTYEKIAAFIFKVMRAPPSGSFTRR